MYITSSSLSVLDRKYCVLRHLMTSAKMNHWHHYNICDQSMQVLCTYACSDVISEHHTDILYRNISSIESILSSSGPSYDIMIRSHHYSTVYCTMYFMMLFFSHYLTKCQTLSQSIMRDFIVDVLWPVDHVNPTNQDKCIIFTNPVCSVPGNYRQSIMTIGIFVKRLYLRKNI